MKNCWIIIKDMQHHRRIYETEMYLNQIRFITFGIKVTFNFIKHWAVCSLTLYNYPLHLLLFCSQINNH